MRQVAAIHRHGSFVKAADEIGVAQPTLSKSISRLEDELGVKLFERSGSGAKVTPMGALIVARAERIIHEAERLSRDIELTASGQVGEARIGFGPALRPVFLPRFAEALAARWPRLRLSLNVQHRDRLLEDLQSGALDILIMVRADELDDRDYVQTEILRDDVTIVVAPTHPLARLPAVSVEEFLRYPNAGGAAPTMLTAPGAHGVDLSGVRQEPWILSNDDRTMTMLTLQGRATRIVQKHLVQEELDKGLLVELPMTWRLTVSITATMSRAASHSPILREIVQQAESIGRSLSSRDF